MYIHRHTYIRTCAHTAVSSITQVLGGPRETYDEDEEGGVHEEGTYVCR